MSESFYERCLHGPIHKNEQWICQDCGEPNEPDDHLCMSEVCVLVRKEQSGEDTDEDE